MTNEQRLWEESTIQNAFQFKLKQPGQSLSRSCRGQPARQLKTQFKESRHGTFTPLCFLVSRFSSVSVCFRPKPVCSSYAQDFTKNIRLPIEFRSFEILPFIFHFVARDAVISISSVLSNCLRAFTGV